MLIFITYKSFFASRSLSRSNKSFLLQDENFFVEAEPGLQLWCNALNEFLLDSSDSLRWDSNENKKPVLLSYNETPFCCTQCSGSVGSVCFWASRTWIRDYLYGSGSFHQQVKKNQDQPWFLLFCHFCDFSVTGTCCLWKLMLMYGTATVWNKQNKTWKPLPKKAESGSVIQCTDYGSKDPIPYEMNNVNNKYGMLQIYGIYATFSLFASLST